MNALATFALAYAGLSALSQSMARHHAALVAYQVPRSPRLRIALRLGATACWLLALATALRHAGVAQGVLLWTGALAVMAPAVMLQLAYAPRTLRPGTGLASAAGLLCALLGAA
ncbi:MAG: DUF3325 domain-containing protein [Burkholderiaceae bacterium]|nr:DUF3325 domain-containing protein [Burkholderiaceae bacterium]